MKNYNKILKELREDKDLYQKEIKLHNYTTFYTGVV